MIFAKMSEFNSTWRWNFCKFGQIKHLRKKNISIYHSRR